ncbi:LysM-like peptidoglycan-binding domain-containing protein [Vibrio quintilis]|uniref:Putative peptidase n=1 Tax=Vibrio quintilis TaxID=1117707 RepID=A0A1M7YQF7_9VIBR|nr:LysM-like peptidoglycan-binding domain-containing protein [Vibrio quintilis]SHO54834.1 putative peptidase [Vibrio quintilis]
MLVVKNLQVIHLSRSLWIRLPQPHRRLLSFLIPVFIVIVFIPWPQNSSTVNQQLSVSNQRVEIELNNPEVLSEQSGGSLQQSLTSAASEKRSTTAWVAYKIQEGDTLSKFFRKNSLPITDLNALLKIEGSEKPLSDIKPGQLIRYKLTAKGQLDILQLEKKEQSVMFFRLSDGGFGRSK